ncbi:MAG: hypothetical protein EOQ52_06915 [Mesorhizobium sp.]|nr:MAG: hypothetical protein EOQ52_06915 [Mesorhizobium sp.]
MPIDPQTPPEPLVQRLMRQTGVSEAQARELVLLIGLNWASLMREAREASRFASPKKPSY